MDVVACCGRIFHRSCLSKSVLTVLSRGSVDFAVYAGIPAHKGMFGTSTQHLQDVCKTEHRPVEQNST